MKGLSDRVSELEGEVQQLRAREAALKGEARQAHRDAENLQLDNANLKNGAQQL